ncbi:DNA translocase FtsK [Phaeocystidibacter luteus]|uniref:DNA translocase FtsK n=1 Tax=Phaeocystidibacter luteus TaxID=911197 RepID=A0A6N6RLB3_9FLAO|nr:DNA translocase FtsK [Phaeocystidibacter luteus]KAB2814279.1 DNA translocase FtsK [Phaeocystidibacter luteus]
MAKTKKQTKKTSKPKTPLFEGWKEAAKDRSVHVVVGLALIFIAAFMTIAFISFLFSWDADQSQFQQSFWELMGNPEYEVSNILSKLGAALGQVFVFKWFGIAAFAIPIFLGAIGLKVSFKFSPYPLLKIFRVTVFLSLWLSAFTAFLAGVEHTVLSGGVGYYVATFLRSWMGMLGLGLLFVFTLIAWLVLVMKVTPDSLAAGAKAILQKLSRPKTEPIAETTVPTPTPAVEDEVAPEVDFDQNEETEEETVEEPQLKSELEIKTPQPEAEVEVEASNTEPEPKPEPTSSEGPEMDVEAAVEEESLSEKEVNKKVKEFGEYDPKLDLSRFKLPPLDLLVEHGDGNITIDQEELEANKNNIVNTLQNYKIGIEKIKATIGPTVTLYEIIPEAGVRISKIKNLEDDIALSLAALGIRIIAPIPGRGTIGIEVPNKNASVVSMRAVLTSEKFQNTKFDLPVALGKTISNETLVADLAKMPHLLMAGATGQGKSVGLNAILASILYKKHPAQVKFVLVDPKKVELTLYNKIERHYLAKLPDTEDAIITDTSKVINTLNSLCIEMDNRYELLKSAMVRNIKEYNAKFINRKLNPEEGHRYLPYIVLVIDEFADLIMTAGKEVETPIARLAQLARAIGIHLIIATQRPSVNVITGIIKANFPARIAFRVTSKIDSRTILDAGGADQLIGKGDMLFSPGNELIRLQCAFLDTPEVDEITEYIGNQQAYPEAYLLPEYVGEESSGGGGALADEDRDALFEDAARIVVIHQQGSASLLQRKLKLGYNRAGRIVDQLEAAGIIGPFEGSKARQVLVPDEVSLEQKLNPGSADIES